MQGVIFANLAAAAATVVILFLRRFFKDKLFAKVFVLLWAAVVLRLLLPFEFSSAVSIYPLPEKPQNSYYVQNTYFESEKTEPVLFEENAEAPKEEPSVSSSQKTKAKISSDDAFFAIWVTGAFCLFAFFTAKHFCAVKKITADCTPFEELPEGFVPAKNVRIYKSKNLCSPLSFGFLRPKIIIPEGTSKEQLPFVLLHENTHVKDRDAVLKFFALLALCLNWFDPFVWVAVKYLDRDMERYCDERVLSSLCGEKASSYAGTILDFAEKESLSLSYFSAASLTERIVSIMNNKNKKSRFPAVLCVFAAIVFIMAACGTVPREPEEKHDYEELAEILEKADWQFSMENQYVIELDEGNLYPTIFKITDENGKEHYSYSCNFTELPVERIVIKDPGIASYIPSEVACFKSHTETISISNYDKLLACGFKVEYNDGEIVISTEEPINAKVPEFSLSIHVNLEETEIISEGPEIFYFGMPNKNEEYSQEKHAKKIRFIDEADEEIFRSVEERDEKMREEASQTAISFTWPCEENEITCAFGSLENHAGIDIGHENGSEIYAAADGEVFFVSDDENEYGACLSIDHGEQFSSFYAHCSEICVEQGDKVKAGDLIAKTGSSGNSTGPHLHFELRKGKTQLDPEDFLPVPAVYESDFEELSFAEKAEIAMEFIRPIEGGYVSCSLWEYKGHLGADYTPAEGEGSDILAVADGKVVKAKWGHTGYGNCIILDHGGGIQTLYAHCHELFVELGDEVKAGDVIASVGSSGNSTGTHLHFELRQNGTYVDPEKYIPEA